VAVGQRDTDGFRLRAADAVRGPEAAVPAGGLQALTAEVAGVVRPGERGDDEVTRLQNADLGTDLLDDTNELVAHRTALPCRFHLVVRVQVAAADAGAHDPHHRVGGLDQLRVGDGLDPDVAGAVHQCRSHEVSFAL